MHTCLQFPSGQPVVAQYPEAGTPCHSYCPEPPSVLVGWRELMLTGSERLKERKQEAGKAESKLHVKIII